MKKTWKRIWAFLLAIALVVTSISYTPKIVSAADGVTATLNGKSYTVSDVVVGSESIVGFVFQGKFGTDTDPYFGFAWQVPSAMNVEIKDDEGNVKKTYAATGSQVIHVNEISELAVGNYTIVFTGTEDTSLVVNANLTITAESEENETTTTDSDVTEPTSPSELEWNTDANLTAALGEGAKYASEGTLYYGVVKIQEAQLYFDIGAQGQSIKLEFGDTIQENSANTALGYGIAYSDLKAGMNVITVTEVLSENDGGAEVTYKYYVQVPVAPTNLYITDYSSITGKYIVKFDNIDGAVSYKVYIDGNETDITLGGSGDYIAYDELASYTAGNHTLQLTAILEDGTETVKSVAATISKPETGGAINDIAQIYVQTDDTNIDALTGLTKTKVTAAITVVDQNGVYDTIYDDATKTTIKVRGNSTADAQKKAFNISFSSKQNVLGVSGEGDKGAKKWSLLANAFDKSLIRNKLAMELGISAGVPYTSSSRYVDLYLNGRYMGNYLLIESVEQGTSRVSIDSENIETYNNDVLVELENNGKDEEGVTYFTTTRYAQRFVMGSPETVEDSTEAFFNQKLANVQNVFNQFETDLENNDYAAYSQYIDVDAFVNFYIVSELFKNQDVAYSSTRVFISNDKIGMGPLWDFDLSSGNVSVEYYGKEDQSATGYQATDMKWFEKLMANDTFKSKVVSRFNELLPTIKNLYTGDGNLLDTITTEIAASIARNYETVANGGAGWSVSEKDPADGYSYANTASFATYSESIEFLRAWLTDRVAFLETEWADSEEPGETPPDYSGITVADDDWTKIDGNLDVTATNPPADGSTWEIAKTLYDAAKDSTYIQFAATGNDLTYGGNPSNTITEPAFAFSAKDRANIASVWVNKTKMETGDTYYKADGSDVVCLAQSLFAVGEITYVTVRYNDGTDSTIAIKVTAKGAVDQSGIEIPDLDDANWVAFKNSEKSSNVAATGDLFYVQNTVLNKIIAYNGPNVGLFANTAALDQPTWGTPFAGENADDPIFAFTRSEGADVSAVVIDGVTYAADGINVCTGDVVYIKQSLFDLNGAENHIFKVTVQYTNLDADAFALKVVKGKPTAPTDFIHAPAADGSLPYYFAWAAKAGADSYKLYIVNTDGTTTLLAENIGGAAYNATELAAYEDGTYTIGLTAMVDGVESEMATTTFTKGAQTGSPDLVVSEVKILTEGTLIPGQNIEFQVTVKNIGNADAIFSGDMILHKSQYPNEARPDDGYLDYVNIAEKIPLVGQNRVWGVNEEYTYTFNYTIPQDADTVQYTIGGKIDADDAVKNESEENNNQLVIPLVLGEALAKADLANNDGNISVSWTADETATGYKVSYVVDGETKTTDAITETNYSFTENDIVLDNNTKVSIIAVGGDNDGNVIAEATALADLTIIELFTTGTAYIGKAVGVRGIIKNIGTAKATSSNDERVLALTIKSSDGITAWETPADGLLPNATTTITVNYTPTATGAVTITGDVNDTGRIYETDRTPGPVDTADNNNKETITVTVVEEGAVKLTPIEGTNNVLVTWKASENAAVTEYVLAYTSNDVVKTSIDGDILSVAAGTMTYDAETNTYSAVISAPLDNNTMVYVYAIDPLDNADRTLVGADMAQVDLIIEEIGEPLSQVRVGYAFNISITVKNQGTAQVKGSDSEDVTVFYPYTIPAMVKWENIDGEGSLIHDGYHSGLLAGASQVLTFEGIAPTKPGEIVFNFKADSHSWSEGVYDGFHAESDEDNNTKSKTITVLEKEQVREMPWTPLYSSANTDENGQPVVNIADFSDWKNMEFKILDTSITNKDFEDIVTEFNGYAGSYISVRFEGSNVIVRQDSTGSTTTTTMYFRQVSSDSVNNFDAEVDATLDDVDPSHNGDGVLNDFAGNGINLLTRSFAAGKYYIIKFVNDDGTYLTMALRVPGDLGSWIQAKSSDNGATDKDALPFVYHRSDLETTGGFYYDGSDLGLATITCYNANWLALTTDGTKTFAAEDNWKIEIQYASINEEGDFVAEIAADDREHVGEDPGVITLQPGDAGLRLEGNNTIHIKLPDLIAQIPIHSANGGATDSEYYYLKVFNDASSEEYISIPVRIIADIPEIEPIQELTGALRGNDLGVAWANPNSEYKYDVYIQHDCTGEYVLLKEGATVEDVYSTDVNGKAIDFDTNNNIKVVAAWCEQTTEATYLLKTDLGDDVPGVEPTEREDQWVLINGEYSLPVTNHVPGDGSTVNANIYYYTDVDISNVVGYNGAYIAINGNEDYFAGAETKLYVQKDGETPLVLEATRIYDKLYPGQIQMNAAKMFETYGEYTEWDGTTELYYTIRVYGDDTTYKDFYFKIVPNEQKQIVEDNGEWVPLKGTSTLPVTFKYDYTFTDTEGNQVTETKELPMDGYIEYYDHQSLTNTYTATGYNSYFISLIGMTDVYSGAGTVTMAVANTGTTDNQDMIKEGGNAAAQDYTDAVIYDQLYPGEIQLNAGQVFTVTDTTTYFMLKITGTDGTTTTTKYLPIRITVKTGDVEIRGFQMNTNTAEGAVSEFNPSFRVVSRASKIMADANGKLHGVLNYGTMYAVDSSVEDADMTLENDGVKYVQATDVGTLTNWSGSDNDADKDDYSYYALTFKSTTYYLDILTYKYKLKAYAVLDDNSIVYQTKEMSETSIYDIAEVLYNNGNMPSLASHNFLYDNVLNIVAIKENRLNIGQAMFDTLQPTSTSDEKYILMNNAYKDLFYYINLTREYEYDRYSQRGTFTSKTAYGDGITETYLLEALNTASDKTYESVADWIYDNVTENGFYRKAAWNGGSTTTPGGQE